MDIGLRIIFDNAAETRATAHFGHRRRFEIDPNHLSEVHKAARELRPLSHRNFIRPLAFPTPHSTSYIPTWGIIHGDELQEYESGRHSSWEPYYIR